MCVFCVSVSDKDQFVLVKNERNLLYVQEICFVINEQIEVVTDYESDLRQNTVVQF